uniref:Alpha-amylase n=1 Tax=Steinernema glaseri TaxID=37863 RepID=A0A1I7YJB7_9BILA
MLLISLLLVLASVSANLYWYDKTQTLVDRETLVHLFEWTWSDVAKECEDFLQHHGFGAVQVSPPNEHLMIYVNDDVPWYVRYQPVSYKLDSRSGNEQEFKDMVERCNRVGVRIVVDVVLNHMVGIGQKKGVNGVNSSGTSDFDGRPGHEDFPGVPYHQYDTNDPRCSHDIEGSDYQNSAYNVKECRLVGLIDLDQNSPSVRKIMQAYLNKLISYGVAGFRFDASKHMWPQDLKALLSGVENLRSDIFGANQRPFAVHEVIDRGGEAVKVGDYLGVGRYTNFNFGTAVAQAIWGHADIGTLGQLGPGYGYGNEEDHDVLSFIDNHDNQRDQNPYVLTYKNGNDYKLGVAYMLAWTYGYARVMSSFAFSGHDQGPPNMGKATGYATKGPVFSPSGTCLESSGWVCEHRWPEIRNMAEFRSQTQGAAVAEVVSENGVIRFARDGKGYFALNNGQSQQYLSDIDTTLPPGDYCDVFEGSLHEGSCTGAKITVDSNGKTSFSIPGKKVIAFHLGSRIQGIPSPPVTPSSWKSTVVFLKKNTYPGQNMFIRGGNTQRGSCAYGPYQQESDSCAINIAHTTNTSFIFAEYLSWRDNDLFLDFEGAEKRQGTHDGVQAQGTPMLYTTNDTNAPEYQPLNTFGPGYWMVELKMDCDRTDNGWFELKGFMSPGIGWETDVQQKACTGSGASEPPIRSSKNHMAKCGMVNVFEWESGSCLINVL